MKFSEQWLREWVDPSVDTEGLGDKLTALGLEVESITQEGLDQVIELAITPNRGDCLSILGVAREVSAGFATPLNQPQAEPVPVSFSETLPVKIENPKFCPRYCGRIIRGVNGAAPTPEWMSSRLEKAGMQAVSILVDIANYVMLELGQPMHTFDLDRLKGGVHLRLSQGERLVLLNEQEVELGHNDLVICDDEKIIALAGIMGSLSSAVNTDTRNIFLESAYFPSDTVAGRARRLGIHSEGAQRWERGVDPALADRAMERATALILQLAGGEAGEVYEDLYQDYLPKPAELKLSHKKLTSLLGMELSSESVIQTFRSLHMPVHFEAGVYEVTAPSYRLDLKIPEDLIEEVIRMVGYNQIPEVPLKIEVGPTPTEGSIPVSRLKAKLIDRGYHEVITYSFVDKVWQEALFPGEVTQDLLNPISPDMGSMRLSIWPGLLKTLAYNQNRQMNDLRLFETGQCFNEVGGELVHQERLAGLIAGQAHPLNWSLSKRPVDFFDLKGDLEALLAQTGDQSYSFVPDTHSALAPGQTAAIIHEGRRVGWIGALHPFVADKLDLKLPVYLFEVELANLLTCATPKYQPLSKFPAIRRDLAVLVDADVAAEDLLQIAQKKAGPLLQRIDIFDVYQGERIEKGKKSIALGLILQESSRTLIDEEVNDLMQAVVKGLEEAFQATVRE